MSPVLLKPPEICTPHVPGVSASIQRPDEDGPCGMSSGCWLYHSGRDNQLLVLVNTGENEVSSTAEAPGIFTPHIPEEASASTQRPEEGIIRGTAA